MACACKNQIRAHKGLVNVGFVLVDCVEGYVCTNMYNAQSKGRTGGLYVDHPGYCLVMVAKVGSRCASARCPSLSYLTTVVNSREMRPSTMVKNGPNERTVGKGNICGFI